MKTILVIYTNVLLTSKKEIGTKKKYAFNVDLDTVEEGDLLDSPEYSTKMQVVRVLDSKYKYYNSSTGKLSNSFNSTSQWDIRTMIVREETDEQIVYATKIKKWWTV